MVEKLTNTKILSVAIGVILLASFFLGNFLLHFIQEVIVLLKTFINEPEDVSFQLDWKHLFIFQTNISAFYIGYYLLVVIGLMKFSYNIKMNYKTITRGQHGTSEFEEMKELKKQYKIIPAISKEYEGSGGTVIAGLQEKMKPYRLLIDDSPVHSMVIGITRSGKGETFVFPMLDVLSRAKDKPSLVVNDPKGELAGASYHTLKQRGYDVHVFNLIQQHMGMGFNPLQLVIDAWIKGNSSLAQQYANSVAFSLYNDPNAKDPFWSNSAKSLVTAIIMALTEDAINMGKEDMVTMYSVANFLSTKGSDNDDEGNNALDDFFQDRDENNPARMMYATSNFSTGNMRASIFSVAMEKLQIFTLEPNAKLTSYNSLELSEIGFGDKPIAVFMVTPDYDQSNHVLASIFVSQLYRVNAEKATMSENGKMKRHVHFMLDEFGNMPTVEGMAGMVTVGAGRGFRFHLIVQAYSQIKSQYGEESDTIIGNCSNQIYILTKDKATAEQYSALIGTKTITDVSRSGKLLSYDKQHNESVKERPLLMPDELMQLQEGESVVVRANKRQDLKRRKIKPKPIFNTGATSNKFRYQYLTGDFDNSQSLLNLPIMSSKYHDIRLAEMVFTSKTKSDLYLKMREVMGKNAFLKIKDMLRRTGSSHSKGFLYEEQIEEWSFLHLLSFIAYDATSNPLHVHLIAKISEYLPPSVIEEWKTRTEDAMKEKKANDQEDSDQRNERDREPESESVDQTEEEENLRREALPS